MKLPILYKKTSTGAIQQWEVSVIDQRGSDTAASIVTRYGQVDGQEQVTSDVISEGKNIGKANETTPRQQAEAEAKSKWEKKKKSGYVERMDDAEADAVDALIEGGVVPMLAQAFSKHGHKIKYPAFVQPKLDGIRCIAIVKNGKSTLWSRTRKPINSVPHIAKELEAAFSNRDIVLDGELYNHEYKSNFEKIVSLVRQEEPDPEHTIVQYHVYDEVSDASFEDRNGALNAIFAAYDFYAIKEVETEWIESEEEVMEFFEKFKKQGYEGAMLRNEKAKYVNKRSYDLQKVKEFDDAEFDIIGIDEGRGKLMGHVGAFICRTQEGKEFLAKMSGDTNKLRDYFQNHSLWRGKRLTVQYQGLTGKEEVPRFPVGIAIRDYE